MKQVYSSPDAPAALGPYSQVIAANGFLFLSGQLGLDPVSGQLAEGVEAQTEQALKNIAAVLKAAGSGFEKALKCTVFLADMNDFTRVNDIYAKAFPAPFPARSAVQVARLPKDALVEIEVIALA